MNCLAIQLFQGGGAIFVQTNLKSYYSIHFDIGILSGVVGSFYDSWLAYHQLRRANHKISRHRLANSKIQGVIHFKICEGAVMVSAYEQI